MLYRKFQVFTGGKYKIHRTSSLLSIELSAKYIKEITKSLSLKEAKKKSSEEPLTGLCGGSNRKFRNRPGCWQTG